MSRPVQSACRALPLSALLLSALGSPSFAAPAGLRIEPAKTRVGLAQVYLEVDELELSGGRLIGIYEVRIPLLPMMNDRGSIEIDLEEPLDDVMSRQGTLTGLGHSRLDGRHHAVTCRFGPDRNVDIIIDTGDRVLAFKTFVHRLLSAAP